MKDLPRRSVLWAFAAGAVLAVPACSENTVTGRSQLVLVSDDQLAQMAAGAWKEMKAKLPVAQDQALQARLAAVGARVAEAAGRADEAWEFIVVDSPEVNAFVLPGGRVGFFRGLIEAAGGDDEIAAVMGHEVGHVAARHAAERVSQQLAVQTGVSIAAALLAENLGSFADEAAAALGAGLVYGVVLPYSREHEYEADRLGVLYAAKAGYDPTGAVRFWERMIESAGDRPKALEFLSTHPADDKRLERLAVEIAALK